MAMAMLRAYNIPCTKKMPITERGLAPSVRRIAMSARLSLTVITSVLTSLFNMTKQVSAKMAERGWGRIVNISSVNGVKGQAGQTNYSAAKAGVIGFTKALAAELAAKGVTVNAITPGYIATKMVMAIKPEILQTIIDGVPMKRLGKPEEMGAACVYLASDLAGFMTGATLNINGGLYYQ
jgi:acetoacetyl-CoA reductase